MVGGEVVGNEVRLGVGGWVGMLQFAALDKSPLT